MVSRKKVTKIILEYIVFKNLKCLETPAQSKIKEKTLGKRNTKRCEPAM